MAVLRPTLLTLCYVLTPVLAWLALPDTIAFWPLLLICLVPLFFLLHGSPSPRAAAWRGLLCGILFQACLLYWISPVLVRFGGLPWILAIGAQALLVIYMAGYLAIFSAGFAILLRGGFFIWLMVFPALWVGLDWVRGWLFSGFPWLDLGYGLWQVPQLLQVADLVGHHGLTYLVLLINGVVFSWLHPDFIKKTRITGLVTGTVAIAVVAGYGSLRWDELAPRVITAPAPTVSIVQGNVAQEIKWSAGQSYDAVLKYLTMSERLQANDNPGLIVWPETALPFFPTHDELFIPVAHFARDSGRFVLTGAPWVERDAQGDAEDRKYHNAALLIAPTGEITHSYYKSHLVPFGEYVPLQRYLWFLQPLVEAAGNFSPGVVEAPLVAGEIKAGVLICFESIFPEIGRAWVNQGANMLVNITNDAWYGRSSAPHQSWAMSVLRAVETRRTLVRAANTGISGVVNPLGLIVRQSDIFVDWADSAPAPLMIERTVFVRGGYLFAPACALVALVSLVLIAIARRTGRHYKTAN
jgi:apolipoprotein N-acyltransferase